MRQFTVILVCLSAALGVASAAKLGYNYEAGLSGSDHSAVPGSRNVEPTSHGLDSEPQLFTPSADIAEPTGQAVDYAAPQAELQKEFFSYTADEEDFNDPAAAERVVESLNKALRVVFIKGPEHNGLENAALALAKQAAQQDTAIYVLNKQTDLGELAQKFNAVRSNVNNKPEVHFIKYRTQEDAQNAQRAIQGQYDQLGGTSQAHDGGVASALNFASAAPQAASAPNDAIDQTEETAPVNSYVPPVTPGSSYLPANLLRLVRY